MKLLSMALSIALSHPSWVCGLKLCERYKLEDEQPVTPFVGVWIETSPSIARPVFLPVTPFVGVWIETLVAA